MSLDQPQPTLLFPVSRFLLNAFLHSVVLSTQLLYAYVFGINPYLLGSQYIA